MTFDRSRPHCTNDISNQIGMRNTIVTVNAGSFSLIFPFYGKIRSPGDEVVVSVVGAGKTAVSDKLFLLPFSVLKMGIRISTGTGSSVSYL